MTATTTEPRLPAAYWRLWWAAAADNLGDGAFAAAVPLLALTITRDPRLISVVSAASFLPWLLLSLPAGAVVDRQDRAVQCDPGPAGDADAAPQRARLRPAAGRGRDRERAGGLVSARIVARAGALPALLTALSANVLIFAGIGASPTAIALGALLALNGFATTLAGIVTLSLRQQVVPPELLGRVNSVYRMLGWGLMSLGALAGGLVAHQLGLRAAYPVAATLRGTALLAALPVLVAEARRRPRTPPGGCGR